MHLPSRLPCYLAFLGLWIIVRLWFTLRLILTYKWVHTMVVLWVWITSVNRLLANFMLPFLTAIIHYVHVQHFFRPLFCMFSMCCFCLYMFPALRYFITLPSIIYSQMKSVSVFSSLFSYAWLEGCLESGIFHIYTVHYSNQ